MQTRPWDGSILLSLPLFLLSALALTGCGDLVPPPLSQKYATIESKASHLEPRLLVVFTYGFGCSADGRGNGLRDTAEAVHRQFPTARVITRAWNDNDDGIEKGIETHNGPVVLVGHSFGGCRSVELSENAHRRVDDLILLDPVPFHDWAIRHSGKYFELPAQVRNAVCFYRNAWIWPLSYAIAHPSTDWQNRVRELGHSDFCDNVEVQRCVLDACAKEMALLKISGVAQASTR